MKKVTLIVDNYLYEFYRKVGERAQGRSAEQVMGDVLFKLAGELSLSALNKSGDKKSDSKK